SESDRPPLLPARLRPPDPPGIEKIHAEATETMPTSGASSEAETEEAAPDSPKADSGKVKGKDDGLGDAHIVQIKRSQTTFEIARTYLGQSNWKAVDKIRALN